MQVLAFDCRGIEKTDTIKGYAFAVEHLPDGYVMEPSVERKGMLVEQGIIGLFKLDAYHNCSELINASSQYVKERYIIMLS